MERIFAQGVNIETDFPPAKTFNNFGIAVEMDEVSVGPTITQYTFKPAPGTKLSRITSLASDLALALAAHPLRIEAPIPGRSLVGIEVPNKATALVKLKDLLGTNEFKNRASNLSVCLGKDVSGKPWIVHYHQFALSKFT